MYLAGLIAALATLGTGVFLVATSNPPGWSVAAAGALGLVVVLVAWPLSNCLESAHHSDSHHQAEYLNFMTDRMQQIAVLMNQISEQQLLSDRAKAVAYRAKDREALRHAIQEEMNRQDWEAALALVTDMESVFGYRQEGDRFREEIRLKREEFVRRQVNDGITVIDRATRSEQWSQALREVDRLERLFPDDEQVRRLAQEIEARRQSHKRQLLQAWHDSVARKDVDGSIEILKKLDLYLTPAEGEQMQDEARGIFKDKLNSLRTQFTSAVQDHRWAEAVRLGEIIVRDFPNAKMAQEVKEKIALLREKASEPEAAKV